MSELLAEAFEFATIQVEISSSAQIEIITPVENAEIQIEVQPVGVPGPPGDASTAVATHEAASDPHPQYLTQSEGDARYPLKTAVYTKSEADTAVDARFTALVNAAPGALDTLGEIAAQLQADESAAAALTTAVAGKENTGVAAALLSAHTGAIDPHPQYLTQSEGDGRYPLAANVYTKSETDTAIGGVSAALSAHAGAVDPHTQYALEVDVATALATKESAGVAAALDAAHVAASNPHPQYPVTYIQQTRPAVSGPWFWWQTDASGAIIDLTINDGTP